MTDPSLRHAGNSHWTAAARPHESDLPRYDGLMVPVVVQAVGRNGVVRQYAAELTQETDARGKYWVYRVRTADGSDFFEARFLEVDDDSLIVEMVNANSNSEFSATGLPEALYAEVARASQRRLLSATNHEASKRFPNERREPEATKIWERLTARNQAEYESDTDRYRLL